MDFYTKRRMKLDNMKAAEDAGKVADSLEVRMALMKRVHDGELTLEEAQDELSRIKRNAKKNGQTTRAKAYRL